MGNLRAIIGLGNPGARYARTRHNTGFIAVDFLASHYGANLVAGKGRFVFGKADICGREIFFVKPTTFVNESGVAVLDFLDYFKLSCEDMLVILDDMALPLGALRLKMAGSDGGHNGLASVIYHLETENFPRLRVGIGKPGIPWIDYVLSNFTEEEEKKLMETVESLPDVIENIVLKGYDYAMTVFNRREREAE